MVYQTEKSLTDLGDKVDAGEKAKVEAAIADLKKALEGDDTADIKAKSEALKQASYKIAEELYKQQAANGAPGAGGSNTGDNDGQATGGGSSFGGGGGSNMNGDNTKPAEDADYEVVDK
jgi:molecular chaperone DnaK